MIATRTGYSEEALNDLTDYFEGAPIGLKITGQDGTVSRANAAEFALLGYENNEDEYLGHHVAEFFADSTAVQGMLDRLAGGETVAEHEATLLRRDGRPQKVLIYANARTEAGEFRGIRCFTFPHPDDLRPGISEIGALRDQSLSNRGVVLSEDERYETYWELNDFFDNGPVGMHIVSGDGLIRRTNRAELAAMGYPREEYVGVHVATFHADQHVIDGMLTDLVGGTPLINFSASLSHKNGKKLPVLIYSNSRMRDGSFINTRCFTVPMPRAHRPLNDRPEVFVWPRNEDLGFTIPGRAENEAKPNPMTLALKYIAARKRPEESLGFLARVSQTLGSAGPFSSRINKAIRLGVPFLADLISVDTETERLGVAGITELLDSERSIFQVLGNSTPGSSPSTKAAFESGESQVFFDLSVASGSPAEELVWQGIRSLMIVSLSSRGRVLGTMTLLRGNAASSRDFGPADAALAEELGWRIASGIDLERLSEQNGK